MEYYLLKFVGRSFMHLKCMKVIKTAHFERARNVVFYSAVLAKKLEIKYVPLKLYPFTFYFVKTWDCPSHNVRSMRYKRYLLIALLVSESLNSYRTRKVSH